MNQIRLSIILIAITAALSGCGGKSETATNEVTKPSQLSKESKPYSEDWESLAAVNDEPDWFLDAKLGIYAHYGPVSTANIDMERGTGWYGLNMYMEKAYDWSTGEVRVSDDAPEGKPTSVFTHHVNAHGHPSEFGYKDIIPLFKPDKFNAEEWAELFAASGAKFAGPVAMHHDNFAMWDSEVTRWNVKDFTGIDLTGELKTSIEAQGLKFLTSFHHAFTWVYYANAHNFDATPETADLYTEKHALNDFKPTKRFHDEWYAKLKEVVDKYEPDVVWFDWWVEELDEDYRQKFIAYYYNKGKEWGKDVVVSYKNTSFPDSVGILDYERGRPKEIKDNFWMTDTSPGAWFFRQNAKFVTPNEIVDILIDIVAKNGLMLLNVPPDPDGSIPQEMQDMLRALGGWLKINGDAIYATRPWTVFGEGPTRIRSGGHKIEKQKIVYNEKDIRFTRKGKHTLYAIVMDAPQQDILIQTLSTNLTNLVNEIESVTMLGSDEKIAWRVDEQGLHISQPKTIPSEFAVAFEIKLVNEKEVGIGGEDDPD